MDSNSSRDDLRDIKNDIKALVINLGEIKTQTALNTASLVEHLRRSQASEDRLTVVEQNLLIFQNTIKTSLKIVTFLGAFAIFAQQILPLVIKLFSP